MARRVVIELPEHLDDQEVESRLRRLGWPSVAAEEQKKDSVRIQLETRELARVGHELAQQTSRIALLEELVARFVERSEIVGLLEEQDAARDELSVRTSDLVERVQKQDEHIAQVREDLLRDVGKVRMVMLESVTAEETARRRAHVSMRRIVLALKEIVDELRAKAGDGTPLLDGGDPDRGDPQDG